MTVGARLKNCLAAGLVLLCAATSRGAEPRKDALAAQRAEFQQAFARVAESPSPVDFDDSARLRSYVLYPYLQAARLAQALRSAGANVPAPLDELVAAFVRAHEGEPVAQELRRSWLAGLAERAKWSDFLAFHRPKTDELALRCQGFSARLELQQTEGLATEVAQTWLTPRSLPDCERAFEWLRASGGLSEALIEQRARSALENNNAAFARQIAQQLPPGRAAPLLQWAALLENPKRGIDALIAAPQASVDGRALFAGWSRLARADRTAARQRYEALVRARGLDAREASRFALALALPLSWDRDADALAWFARVDPRDFDDTAREWQVRAALWAGDWKLAAQGIDALSDANKGTARWRYWTARAAAATGDGDRAHALYEALLPEDNYYSAMAAARLARKAKPNPEPLPVDEAQVGRVEALAPFTRARELRASGLTRDAMAEWRFGQESLQAGAVGQAAHLAARWGWYDQAIATASAARVFFDYHLLYPHPYDEPVQAAAKFTKLAPEIIYGVIRQESLFRPDAVSTADARGLMQLQLDTARRTARAFRQPPPSSTSLFDPAVNVTLGAAHLRELLDRFGGQLPVAFAGYNAGPNAAQRWLPSAALDPDIWIENIPYNETRAYVQRILWHSVVFAWLRKGEAQDTRAWLAPVKP